MYNESKETLNVNLTIGLRTVLKQKKKFKESDTAISGKNLGNISMGNLFISEKFFKFLLCCNMLIFTCKWCLKKLDLYSYKLFIK